ncbi:hypothetical protein F5148DRAFT_1285531 [Russula earlei]|uniref:Uncharacterized protein n=1 Tax=Russula earlei TaxID=71964 RepID=A0ACC0U7P8_9AGAM|nr:hypothetical protein F5148DRAFT_1285531 [Russula earlei]
MSQTGPKDLESKIVGNVPDDEPPHGATYLGDNSESLYTIYSKIPEEDDKEMVEDWQKVADGMLIFDLRPSSLDTSAFYLEKMYQLQADPNASPSSVVQPLHRDMLSG